MKILIFLTAVLLTASNAFADVEVRGYHRSNGTYVESYHRSDPNGSSYDNWSTKGNVNPYTGEYGHRRAY